MRYFIKMKFSNFPDGIYHCLSYFDRAGTERLVPCEGEVSDSNKFFKIESILFCNSGLE
ncbi:hypothetical protein [Changchengzhania lutea]|uniref:hypothetical protein n=1 Tax=Changchengzhania lutea TaxID=2049305 RepID=UPI00163DCFF4|nr:hypothetical protein [Changchengzhania lutea]